MEKEITFSCSPPDPKTQPKITSFFDRTTGTAVRSDTSQPRITSFFEKSPTTHRTRKAQRRVMEELSLDCSTEDDHAPQPKRRKVGRPRKATNKTTPMPKIKRPVGRPRKNPLSNASKSGGASAQTTESIIEDVVSDRAKQPICKKIPSVEPVEDCSIDGVEEIPPPPDILLQETTVLTSQEAEKRPVGRPRKPPIPSPSTKPKEKQTRMSHSIQKKQEVVEYAKKHSIYKASIHYGLSCGTIGPWVKKDFSNMEGHKRRSSGGGRKLSYPPEIEEQLTEWILEQRDLQPNLSIQDIVDHAVALVQPICPTFRGTRGWLHKFMSRNNLLDANNAPLNKKLPAPLEEKIKTFLESIREARNEYDYPKELVGNMDQVSVQIDMASNRKAEKSTTTTFPTYTVGGETRSYTVGAEKQYVTVILAATAEGTLLPPMVIFRGTKPPKNTGVPR